MFGSLFDGESDTTLSDSSNFLKISNVPPLYRGKHKFCGLQNQGATCYLNALLQTLTLTPEFRNGLFKINSNELHGSGNGKKTRSIPLFVRQLFAQLILLDVESVSTQELTDSFGWDCNEGLLQHDVQEMNRILFTAIETSLSGTSGANLIHKLYKGIVVNKIQCLECPHLSRREEDFMDLCLPVLGCETLLKSLETFTAVEELTDNNKYFCSGCDKLSNAAKCCKIKCPPQILTISLLRFNFDFKTLERYKETSRLDFPHSFDITPYCEENNEEIIYELFSVIVHSGGSHGGHYKAYICDVDDMGCWFKESDVKFESPKKSEVNLECPIEVVCSLLNRDTETSVEKLCQILEKQHGMMWSKKYKPKYGPITKFLKKYDDYFDFKMATNTVKLKNNPTFVSNGYTENNLSEESNVDKKHWFEFDDTRITPILPSDIEKQYSGSESAYMLFYRKQKTGDVMKMRAEECVPQDLMEQIKTENERLNKLRKLRDEETDEIEINVYLGWKCQFENGAIQPLDRQSVLDVRCYKFSTVRDILDIIKGQIPDDCVRQNNILHILKELPSGLHPIECMSDKEGSTPTLLGSKLLIWNGKKIGDLEVLSGPQHEPILLTISLPLDQSLSHAFPLSTTINKVKRFINEKIFAENDFSIVKESDVSKSGDVLEDSKTIKELNLKDFQTLTVVFRTENNFSEDFEDTVSSLNTEDGHKRVSFVIENHCHELCDGKWPKIEVDVSEDYTVEELKVLLISQSHEDITVQEVRLAVPHMLEDSVHCLLPLPEHTIVKELITSKQTSLVLQACSPLTSNQMMLFVKVSHNILSTQDSSSRLSNQTWGESGDLTPSTKINLSTPHTQLAPWFQIIASRDWSVSDLMKSCKEKIPISFDEFHFARIDWFGDASESLIDESVTFANYKLNNGDSLCLRSGKALPKGHIKLLISCINSVDKVESITISKSSTLRQLKERIVQTYLSNFAPTLDHLRLYHVIQPGNKINLLKLNGQQLMTFGLTSNMQLVAQCLAEEEILSKTDVILQLKLRVQGEVDYWDPLELKWDTSQGATAQNLIKQIASKYSLPEEVLHVAKYNPQKVESLWTYIPHKNNSSNQNKKKGKHKKHSKHGSTEAINLKISPYFINDMDIIGILVANGDSAVSVDEFYSSEDLKRRIVISDESFNNIKTQTSNKSKPLRHEPCIKIKVDV